MEKQLLARAVNQQILETAQRFGDIATADAFLIGFMCECGCLELVHLTTTQYRELGALIDGHALPLFPPVATGDAVGGAGG